MCLNTCPPRLLDKLSLVGGCREHGSVASERRDAGNRAVIYVVGNHLGNLIGHRGFDHRRLQDLRNANPPRRLRYRVGITAFIGVCLSYAPNATGQTQTSIPTEDEPVRWQFGIGVLAGVPTGDFATHVDSAGGVHLHLDRGLGDSMFSLGGEFAYTSYGHESREVALSSLIPEIPNASVTINTDNEMVLLHGRVRAQRRLGRWRPYADGLFGFTNLFTTTSIDSECRGSDCSANLADATNSRDFALSYGGGAGVTIGFRSSPRPPRLDLDLSVRYLRGTEAQYLTEGAIRREGGRAFFDFSRSRTDMVAVYIGIAFGR